MTNDLIDLVKKRFPDTSSIAICGSSFHGRGGDSRVIETQATTLADAGYSVGIFVLDSDMGVPEKVQLNTKDIDQKTMWGRLRRLLYPVTFSAFRDIRRLADYDLVIIHRYPYNAVGALVKATSSTNMIFWSHPSSNPSSDLQGLEKIWVGSIHTLETRLFVDQANLICSISEQSREYISQYVESEIVVVHNKINTDRFEEQLSVEKLIDKYSIDPDKQTILYVGRLTEKKNLDHLIDSFIQLKENKSDVQLVIVGSASRESYLEKLEQKSGDDVIFTGYVSDPELGTLYDFADIFATCSSEEGWGLPISEADYFNNLIVALESHPATEYCRRSITVQEDKLYQFTEALTDAVEQAKNTNE